MVKIKTKKKMNLPELIQWSWDNGEEQRFFHGSKDGSVCFNDDSWVTIVTAVEPDETFTFEVEEEIKENTIIPKLFYLYEYIDSLATEIFYKSSIKQVLDLEDYGDVDSRPKAFYLLNEDMTMTLLWKGGEMVE